MNSKAIKLINMILREESGYANVSGDLGGETYRGITRKNFPKWDGWKIVDENKPLKKGEIIIDHLGYRTHTSDGRILKSSTVFLKDTDGTYRYILGINYDITSLVNMESAINSMTIVEDEGEGEKDGPIAQNVNDLLDSLIDQSVKLIGKPPALMTKDEKIRAIQFLKDAGAFLVTKSGDKVSSFYGISKFTLYSYIDQTKK